MVRVSPTYYYSPGLFYGEGKQLGIVLLLAMAQIAWVSVRPVVSIVRVNRSPRRRLLGSRYPLLFRPESPILARGLYLAL